MYDIAVDIGGTFTDLVGCIGGRIVTSKTSTVPADPTRGVAESSLIDLVGNPVRIGPLAQRGKAPQHQKRHDEYLYDFRGDPECLSSLYGIYRLLREWQKLGQGGYC